MLFNKNIKIKDILILMLLLAVGYVAVDNYEQVFALARKLVSLLKPFTYALIIAYCLNPLMKVFEKRLKVKKGLAIALSYISILGLIALGFVYILPGIVNSIISITAEVPSYMEAVQAWINAAMQNEKIYGMLRDSGLLNYLSGISSNLGRTLINILEGSIASVFSITAAVVNIVIGAVISIYVLADKENLGKGAKTVIYMVFKEKKGEGILEWINIFHNMIGHYIGAKALDSAIIGAAAFIGLIIMKAPYAPLIALVFGITNMIPYIGPLIGELVGAVIGLFVSPVMALTILLFLLLLQQLDAWFLDPKLVGEKVGVKPFFLILAVTVGGGFFGAVGMLLASPAIATLKIFYDRRVAEFKNKNSRMAGIMDK